MSTSIRLVTVLFLFLIGSLATFDPRAWVARRARADRRWRYLLAPVAYSLEDGRLIAFAPVVRCSHLDAAIEGRIPFSLRLFGNGGLFAGIGISWNRRLGVFRADVTSSRRDDLVVLLETTDRKIVISPEDPWLFVQSWEQSRR